MITIIKLSMSVLLLAFAAAGPMGCVNINRPPDNSPKTEVNVGGERGVIVDHPNDK